MRNGAGMWRGVPLYFDGVAGFGATDGHGRGHNVAVYVAGYVVGGHVGLREIVRPDYKVSWDRL